MGQPAVGEPSGCRPSWDSGDTLLIASWLPGGQSHTFRSWQGCPVVKLDAKPPDVSGVEARQGAPPEGSRDNMSSVPGITELR